MTNNTTPSKPQPLKPFFFFFFFFFTHTTVSAQLTHLHNHQQYGEVRRRKSTARRGSSKTAAGFPGSTTSPPSPFSARARTTIAANIPTGTCQTQSSEQSHHHWNSQTTQLNNLAASSLTRLIRARTIIHSPHPPATKIHVNIQGFFQSQRPENWTTPPKARAARADKTTAPLSAYLVILSDYSCPHRVARRVS